MSLSSRAPARPPTGRGRPLLPSKLPAPLWVYRGVFPTLTRDGRICHRLMYLPALWPPYASHPTFFPADPRTPWNGRGAKFYRMFTRHAEAARWLTTHVGRLASIPSVQGGDA